MSEMTLDESYDDAEWWGRSDDAEYDFESEGEAEYDYDAEAEASRKRRRSQRQRRIEAAVARNRLAKARSRSRRMPARPKTTAAAIRQTKAEVNKVELENKVTTDAVQTALGRLDKRVKGNTGALVAIPLLAQLSTQIDTFLPGLDQGTKDIINGLLRFGHVPFLKPQNPNTSFYRTPGGMAALGAGALLVGGEVAKRLNDDNNGGGGGGGMKITDYTGTVYVGGKTRWRVNVDGPVTWTSEDTTIATVDADGVVTGIKAGTTNVKVEGAGDFDIAAITVLPTPK
jgi:uncharacterized protein YjdB